MKYTDPVKEYVGLSNLCQLKIGQFLEITKCKGKAWSGIHISLEKEESSSLVSLIYPSLLGRSLSFAWLQCGRRCSFSEEISWFIQSNSSDTQMNWLHVPVQLNSFPFHPASWIMWLKTESLVSKCTTQFIGIFLKMKNNLFSLTKLVEITCVFSSELHCGDSCM